MVLFFQQTELNLISLNAIRQKTYNEEDLIFVRLLSCNYNLRSLFPSAPE